ncbi:hypothetical protein Gbfr_007_287 [Gluconobacter frateurii M-2]|nr:hypothetical protein Gbfr_007_287 [Gluconobacter frateurii M-2]
MQTQIDVAKQLLFGAEGLRVTNVKLYPGSDRDATSEQMSAQIVSAINGVIAGDFEDITDCVD